MINIQNIMQWVERTPVVIIRLNETYSYSLVNSRNGFEYFSIAKPHALCDSMKTPAICLMKLQDSSECYLGTITSKAAVTTCDTRIIIKTLTKLSFNKLNDLLIGIPDTRMKNMFRMSLDGTDEITAFTPKLSSCVIKAIEEIGENYIALKNAADLLKKKQIVNEEWAENDAIELAKSVFGLQNNERPVEEIIYEDNVIRSDAFNIPGFEIVANTLTGKTVFKKANEQLTIYTANKLPLEQAFGVDLIYINDVRRNIVMLQYKMLEPSESDKKQNLIYRFDKQIEEEINRMKIPSVSTTVSGYRMTRNPFFFKFVQKNSFNPTVFIVSYDHLMQIRSSPNYKGPRGGIRLSYESLEGIYLRQADIIGLIRSGYIGTHREETEALSVIIESIAKGNRDLVIAWQQIILEDK